MFSLPSQPRINVDRSGEIYRLKITLFSSKILPLTGLPQDKIINDIDLNPSLTSTSFRTTKILCSWSTVKLAKPQNYLSVCEKRKEFTLHIGASEKFEHVFTSFTFPRIKTRLSRAQAACRSRKSRSQTLRGYRSAPRRRPLGKGNAGSRNVLSPSGSASVSFCVDLICLKNKK